MGLTRLLLALGVLLSHAGVRLEGLNPGVTAVIGFYLISGYVMTGLVDRHFASPARVPGFYVDRVLRLFPQYLVYAAITLAWYLGTGSRTMFLARDPGALDLFRNLTVIPLNFYMFNGADSFTLIPPAWSLGAELQFYLVVPLMVFWPRGAWLLAAASLAVQGAALLGALHTDWFGYRLLPGVLWVFGAGMLLFRLQRSRPAVAVALACAAPLAALAIHAVLRARGLHAAPYHQEVLLGWGFGIPLLHVVSRLRSGRIDSLAGDVSYGVFLNHFLLIWLFFPGRQPVGVELAMLAVASIALSWGTQVAFERPALAWRRRLRVSSPPGREERPARLLN
ncbi:MAG TPA: acyltransferase [Zeimonas sp.]